MIKKILLGLMLILLLFVAYTLFNTFTFESKQIRSEGVEIGETDPESLKRFAKALQIRTVSPENAIDFDSIQFNAFNEFLKNSYPLVDSLLGHETFNHYSHLYKWQGSNSQLKPGILMGHLDVVPVIEENRKYWKADPFGGEVIKDTIWGRGSIDDKIGVIGLMEAVEQLLATGYQPERTFYLAIGHDEEIGGLLGAKTIAAHLKEQGVVAEFVIDEGGSLTRGMVPGLDGDAALIGIAEKGFVSLYLTVEMEGGHSSMPEKETAIDVMAKAISKLKNNPFPTEVSPALKSFMEYIGPEMPFVNKMAFANSNLFSGVILNAYQSSSSGNAMVRTTTSPTIFNSGVKDNIIPLTARATVNFRILSESSVEEVIKRVSTVIDDDRVRIEQGDFNSEPSKVSDVNALGFRTIQKTISEVFPQALVAPYLVVGATDARHFAGISDQIFRFSPIRISKSNVKSFHGLNERLAVEDFNTAIRFYVKLIQNTDSNP